MSINNSDRDNIVNKIDRKRMSNDSDSIEKRNDGFNNISEIKKEQIKSKDNGFRRKKDNLKFKKKRANDFDDDIDNNKSGKNQYGNIVIKKIDEDLDSDLKSSNFNDKKSGISESTKRIKKKDGLDEVDNNFNKS